MIFLGDLKWNGLLQLTDKNITLRQRVEYLRYVEGAKLHLALAHAFNFSTRESSNLKTQFSILKDKLEFSLRAAREGTKFGGLDWASLGLTWYDIDTADFGVQLKVDPNNLKEGKKDLFLAIGKKFAPNFYAKAKYNWFTGIAGYYAFYQAHANCSLAGTFEVSHARDANTAEGGFKGCCEYPFNFGIQLNFNA